MKFVICWFRSHRWEPPVTHKEDWHAYEDNGPNGGLTMAYAPGKGSEANGDYNFIKEYTSRHCSYCDKTEWL